MATVQTWNKTRTPNIYVREAKTSPTSKLWKAYYPSPKDENGKRRQLTKTFTRESEARDFLNEVSIKKATGRLTDPKAAKRHLRELYEEMHARRKYAPETIALHGYVWAQLAPLHELPLGDINGAAIDKVLDGIEKGHMQDKARSLLSTLFKYAMETEDNRRRWGVVTNPAIKPARKKTRAERRRKTNGKRYLKDDELSALIRELPDRYKALVFLMSRMGLRPGEAYAIMVGKFDPDESTLLIDTAASGDTKTGEARTLVLPVVIANILAEHIDRFSDPNDPHALIFPTEAGTMIHDGNFRNRVFYPARDRAGIEGDLTPNSCRHTAASFAINHNANVHAVQNMLGHAKPSITLDVYSDLWEEKAKKLAADLDEALRGDPILTLVGSITAELPTKGEKGLGERGLRP